MRTSSTLALALAAALIAGPALAQEQSSQNGMASGLPAACADLGPALDQETLSRIEDMSERRQALSCMVGTPRDYRAELSARDKASKPEAVNVEEAFGTDAVAQGLEQSAEANAAVTSGDLQTAVNEDRTLNEFLRSEGYAPIEVIGYLVTPTTTYLYLAPDWSADAVATGSISADQLGPIDTDSDGTISPDELTAVADTGSVTCAENGLESLFTGLGDVDEAFAATADKVRVVEIANCEPADVEASLGSETSNNIRLMLSANDYATSAVQAEGGTIEDVVRAGKAGDELIIFIPANPVEL